MIFGSSLLGACAREKDAVVMFISRGAQCELMIVEQEDQLS